MSLLTAAQILVAFALIILILFQERSSGVSGIFGMSEGGFYQRRRGMEKIIFWATVVLVAVFAILSLLNLTL